MPLGLYVYKQLALLFREVAARCLDISTMLQCRMTHFVSKMCFGDWKYALEGFKHLGIALKHSNLTQTCNNKQGCAGEVRVLEVTIKGKPKAYILGLFFFFFYFENTQYSSFLEITPV